MDRAIAELQVLLLRKRGDGKNQLELHIARGRRSLEEMTGP